MGLKTYFKESFNELVHKVTWPSWTELQNSGALVLVATIIIALIVFVMDYAFGGVMSFVYSLLY